MSEFNCIQTLILQLHKISMNILKEIQVNLDIPDSKIGIFGNKEKDYSIIFWCRGIYFFKDKSNDYIKSIGLDHIYKITYNPPYASKQSVYRLQLKETANLNDILEVINLYKLQGII